MNGDLRRRALDIFSEALERPAHEREAFVGVACATDDDLRTSVLALLEKEERSRGFLATPLIEPKPTASEGDDAPDDSPALPPGTRIGRYLLQELIGRGGMGSVYKAAQEYPERTVALKLFQGAFAAPGASRRFMEEARFLARLQHPGIAQVYDSGTHAADDGRRIPYFVMEYVEGARTIVDYCRDERLARRKLLELFARACDAVHHAHQRGVIHRDLKPGNILVDRAGQPKVIDFGVARLVEASDGSVATRAGQLIGTVRYMSPEQCGGDPADVDVRTDVYSLGAVLYELLCGRPPHEVDGLNLAQAARRIAEDEVSKPSEINTAISKDMDLIVLHALERERGRRYPSAEALGEDIRRYLVKRPIRARGRARGYRAWMFARHNRLLVGASLGAVGSLVGGLGAALWQADLAQRHAYAAAVSAANAAINEDNNASARAFLGRAPVSHRGWEWNHLMARTDRSLDERTVFDDRNDPAMPKPRLVEAVDASHDGKTVITGARDGSIVEWNAPSLVKSRALTSHPSEVYDVAISHDDRFVASISSEDASHMAKVLIQDRETGGVTRQLELNRRVVENGYCLAFSPADPLLAAGSGYSFGDEWGCGFLCVWETGTWQPVAGPNFGHTRAVMDVAFSPNGKYLAAASDDYTVGIWHTDTWVEVRERIHVDNRAYSVAFSPDGLTLAASTYGGFVYAWNTDGWSERFKPIRHGKPVKVVRFFTLPSGKPILASAGFDQNIKIWSPDTGDHLATLRGHGAVVNDLVMAGGNLLSVSADGTIRRWGDPLADEPKVFRGDQSRIITVAFSADGRLASLSRDGTVIVRDPAVPGPALWSHTDSRITWIAWTPLGDRLVVGGSHFGTKQTDALSSLEELEEPSPDAQELRPWIITPFGSDILIGQSGGAPKVICAIAEAPDRGAIDDASPDALTLTKRGILGLARVPTTDPYQNVYTIVRFAPGDERPRRTRSFSPLSATAFSASGRYFVHGDAPEAECVLLDVRTGDRLGTLEGRRTRMFSFAFSHDDARIASLATDGEVKLWDRGTCEEILTLYQHGTEPTDSTAFPQRCQAIAFSRDDRFLAAGFPDGTIRVWDSLAPRERAN